MPVEESRTMRALADSAVAMAEAGTLPIRRSPQQPDTSASLSEVQAALSVEGLALTSATHVFITYRFRLKGSSLQRDIRDLHFIYRPTTEQGEDIPILYLDLSENDLYNDLLVQKGLPSPVNEAVFYPFADRISFQKLRDEATVVQVGDQIIRDPQQAAAEKEKILRTIRKLTYN